jgi:hypothetical protein
MKENTEAEKKNDTDTRKDGDRSNTAPNMTDPPTRNEATKLRTRWKIAAPKQSRGDDALCRRRAACGRTGK